ncbi:MAG: ATPase [Candidatus Taylorbacteria bacterium RIFCSPLOWO2_02_FULL_43_11]|uniref:ATPase n=1 Tax=Candidatus Taylorbacteria bacterium RIFCSPHIGHO2_02_FULL_43_32b TaxID=1802306 RepID=A0A1G2MKZ6_9BACT|nr:MAG: ATPase [Candidatus Taylorbacteria bacterium RIFCSPHIGHO2_02_FULL_43_32b]OHA35817.1 MAG: ATPase [Candidatus Taylorbacteria bacterium RIFCSPLOWO2_02_FULL_43_11]
MNIEDTKILNNLRRCTRCVLPETHESVIFDKEGVCNVCRNSEVKKTIDWKAREKELHELVEQYRGKGVYDCIIPFSGGKDSTYTLWYVVERLKLKPLVVSFDHGFYRPRTVENNEKTQRTLGVDFLKFRSDWKVVRLLMKEALKRKGDFDWHAHAGSFAYPMQIAVKHKIPLLFWGEPSAEYTAYYNYNDTEEVDERRFNRFVNLGITAEDMQGFLKDKVTARDLDPYRYPALQDLKALNVRSVCLGSYIPWDVKKNSDIISKKIGWQGDHVEGVPPKYYYEKIEYQLQGPRDYLKFIKRGYARTTHLCSIDIRNGRMTRGEAAKLIRKYEGKRPPSLDYILKIIGITEKEWRKIAVSHTVPPYKHDFSKEKNDKMLWDMKLWDWKP